MNAETTLTAEDHRALAAQKEQDKEDSFQRCDTDGFLSQWASGLSAERHRLAADIKDNGGRWEFRALFDLNGNLVAAKQIETVYGTSWGLLESDDPKAQIKGWFNASRAQNEARRLKANAAKGYRMGTVLAPAAAVYQGRGHGLSGTCWVSAVRTDGGFSRDVEIVDIDELI
jgi:hypothetical protein